jgi:hypothetical protein
MGKCARVLALIHTIHHFMVMSRSPRTSYPELEYVFIDPSIERALVGAVYPKPAGTQFLMSHRKKGAERQFNVG